MTPLVAEAILSSHRRGHAARFLRRDEYAKAIQELAGGGTVTLGDDVVGGYVVEFWSGGWFITVRADDSIPMMERAIEDVFGQPCDE